MAEVKVSALTALTGANVANGDELYIVDTGSPNVSKKITADELAQMPQLSSRYKPLASDRLWLDAAAFVPTLDTPALGTLGPAPSQFRRTPVLLFDANGPEMAHATFVMPVGWATASAYLWWSNADSGSGDVYWMVYSTAYGDGDDTSASSGTGLQDGVITAPAQYVLKRSLCGTALTATAGNVVRVAVRREGGAAGDTLGNDAGFVGLELVRAS